MPEYLSPGVYIEEIDSGPKPIEGVSTSTAAFIGFTEKVPYVNKLVNRKYVQVAELNQPKLVTSWPQYVRSFGGFAEGAFMPYSVFGFFQNGGQRCYVVSIGVVPKAQKKLLNGKVSVEAKNSGLDGQRIRFKFESQGKALPDSGGDPKKKPAAKGKEDKTPPAAAADDPASFNVTVQRQELDGSWQEVEKITEVTVVETEEGGVKKPKVAYKYNRTPQWVDIDVTDTKLPLGQFKGKSDWEYLEFGKEEKLPEPDPEKLVGDVSTRTGLGCLEALDDVSIVCMPDLMVLAQEQEAPDVKVIKYVQDMIVSHCERMGDRVAVLDPPPDLNPQGVKKWKTDNAPDSSYAALYYPWVEIMDPGLNRSMFIPPSGHVAGVWARSDGERGVHKAPANEIIKNITGLAYDTTKGEQDTLNPIGVNCIRTFPGRGTRIWGARTLSSNPSWRYLNVRRLFNYVEKSIENSTQWVVFEPNDYDLWARVKRDVTSFLKTVWASGALFGQTPDEAFYVKCDESLNPPESRDLGRLVIEIAMAPVKPAEFVIFRIMQKSETS